MGGKITINVCMGTGGIAAGAVQVMDAFRKELDAAGITDAKVEKNCKLHKVGCRGFCARDVLVDISIGEQTSTYQYIEEGMVERLVKEHVLGGNAIEEWLVGEDYASPHIDPAEAELVESRSIKHYDQGYKAVETALAEMSPEDVIATIRESGLRGRGGAGFLTGLKWSFCAANEEKQKYIVCNADEGDPGAFMDRSMPSAPALVISIYAQNIHWRLID